MSLSLPPFALERWFAPREFVAKHHASSSDCEPLALDALLAGTTPTLRDALHALKLGYTDVRGTLALRQAIAPLHDVTADDVLCVTPSEGITLAMLALVEPGDVVVAAMPGYQSLFDVARAQGATIRSWMPREDRDAWRFDPDDLKPLAKGAKVVVVNFPHNPTGAYPTPDEWRAINAICDDNNAVLFSDEMYRLLESSSVPQLPSASTSSPRGIALCGLSKSLSASGLRQGWLATRDRSSLDRIAALKDYTTICGNVVGELLAQMVLADRDRIAAENRARIAANAQVVDDVVARNPRLAWKRPRAGSTALLHFTDNDASANAISDAVFREKSVLLLPSTVFAFGDKHARLGLGRAGFARALELVDEHLRA